MKFWLSLLYEPVNQLLDHARMAEELGFEGVVLPDHVVIKEGGRTPHPSGYPLRPDEPFLDPLLVFAAMAAVTSRLKFLNYVYVVPLRDPFILAKQAGTLALLSNDRYVLGTGVGWLKEEFDAVGPDFSSRGKRMDEMLAVLRDFWDDGYAEFHGEHFEFPRSGMFPKPNRQVPIWIGGHSMTAARRAADFDGYMPMRGVNGADMPLDEQTTAEFAMIDELRRRRGQTAPYERMIGGRGIDRPNDARRLEEAHGVTNLLMMPWTMSDPTVTVDQKRSLATRFAEQVIRRL
jgi:probable F420-dependent oxidoreductase